MRQLILIIVTLLLSFTAKAQLTVLKSYAWSFYYNKRKCSAYFKRQRITKYTYGCVFQIIPR